MISHVYKCIFIHIPRCAGTSIETWLCGRDWWEVDASTKHLTASQTRNAYCEFWEHYFKFAVVRDPYSRTISLLKHADHFGLRSDSGQSVDFSGYEELFGQDIVVEHDHRFSSRDLLMNAKHRPGQVYGNILDEQIDFIGKFENLATDMALVQRRLGVPEPFNFHVEQSSTTERFKLSPEDRSWVAATYADDFSTFGYSR